MKNKIYPPRKNEPKILLLDIETVPLLGWCWSMWENNLALNQIERDWSILAWSAKWLNDPKSKTMYEDLRNVKNIEDDKKLLQNIWKLIDECDVVVTQNGKKFDIRKLNARFIIHGMKPPSSFRHIDTLQLARKNFAFTSHKLEYMSNKLCSAYKKRKVKKYQGFELWKECMAGNIEAWKEMELYNKMDVLALEELYKKLSPWDNSVNLASHHVQAGQKYTCSCGNTTFSSRGLRYTNTGVFQRRICKSCGKEHKVLKNLFTKEQKAQLRGDNE